MSKTDDLRKKMNSRVAAPTFTPRPSVTIQPLTQAEEKPVQSVPKTTQVVTKKSAIKQSKPKQPVVEEELVALYAKIPKEDKRWLDHYRIDHGEDLSDVVSQAIGLLKKQAENG